MTRHWLFKTEPDSYSIDDLQRDVICPWEGIRNYQARNRLRDEVQVGDQVLIYHSSCATPAIVGLAEVVTAAEPDPTQFDPASAYFDQRLANATGSPSKKKTASTTTARWLLVTLGWRATFATPLTLREIKQDQFFADMELVSRGRLSIQTVAPHHFDAILQHCQHDAP